MTSSEVKSVFADLDSLAIDNAAGSGLVREIEPRIGLGRPGPQTWFCSNPDPKMSFITTLAFDVQSMGKEPYLVTPNMRPAMIDLVRPTLLTPYITRQGDVRMWPLPLPMGEMRPSAWYETAREAIERSKKGWIRMSADVPLGAYRIYQPQVEPPAPVWPNKTLEDMLEMAFKGRVINSPDHFFVRRVLEAT